MPRQSVPLFFLERIPDFPGKERLTARELQVLYYLVRDYTSKGIAQVLKMSSYRTVEAHAEHIHSKLGFTSLPGKRRKVRLLRLVYSLDEIDELIAMGAGNVQPNCFRNDLVVAPAERERADA